MSRGFLFLTKDERSAASDRVTFLDFLLLSGFSVLDCSLELDSGLLGELGLLAEDGLGLATETFLCGIISTLSLSDL